MVDNFSEVNDTSFAGSIYSVPLFSYLLILNNKCESLFKHSFNFEDDLSCETFSHQFEKKDSFSENKLNQVTDIVKRLFLRRILRNSQIESYFIELSERNFYFCLLKYHNLYFIAVYSEDKSGFSGNVKDFIKSSLQGIASAFIAINVSDIHDNSIKITQENLNMFLQAIPIIVSQSVPLSAVRNCSDCPDNKNCIPKLLEKKIQLDN